MSEQRSGRVGRWWNRNKGAVAWVMVVIALNQVVVFFAPATMSAFWVTTLFFAGVAAFTVAELVEGWVDE